MSFFRVFRIAAHLTTLLVLPLLSYRLRRNLRFLRRAQAQARRPAADSPRVSVLVPARNEARTITACVSSLMRQDYPDLEVIVLDDGSTDDTGEQLDALAARYPQLKVLRGVADIPSGWNGKSCACHRLAQQATGAWLLFTDADTQHMPHSVRRGIAQALALDVSLLSALPDQQTATWGERVLVPFIVNFLPLVWLDLAGIARGTSRRTAANGQYLLVNAHAYRTAGGHMAICSELVDDFALARQMQTHGFKIALVDGTEMLRCRMYSGVREVWDGFSKNLLLGLRMSALEKRPRGWFVPFAWAWACLFVLPFGFVLFGVDRRLALVEIGWLALLRAWAGRQLKRPNSEALTTPLAAWGVMALGLSVLFRRWRARPVVWKGRPYQP
jgi:chlorobactene glucosyltransferase